MKSLSFCVSFFFIVSLFSHSTSLHKSLNISHSPMPLFFSFLSKLPIYSQFIQSFSISTHCLSIDLCPKFFSSWEAIVHTGSKKSGGRGFESRWLSISFSLSPSFSKIRYWSFATFLLKLFLTNLSFNSAPWNFSKTHFLFILSFYFFLSAAKSRKKDDKTQSFKDSLWNKKRLFLAWRVNPSFSFSTLVSHLFRFFLHRTLFCDGQMKCEMLERRRKWTHFLWSSLAILWATVVAQQ